MAKIREVLPSLDDSEDTEVVRKHFLKTVTHLRGNKEKTDSHVDYSQLIL